MHQKIVFGALCAVLLALTACNSPEPNTQNQPSVGSETMGMPSSAIDLGRTRATEQFIAKKWRVVSINHDDALDTLTFDLTHFAEGWGEFDDGCEKIVVDLNTRNVSKARLSVENSTRQNAGENECSSDIIDRIMWTLSDVYAFERDGNDLLIIAMQDTIRLSPIR